MISDPQSFFRFAARFYPLLSDLYYRAEGLSDGDLLDLIRRHLVPDDPSCEHIMDRLIKLCIIETVPGEASRWEITHPVRSLLRFLLREQRLTSVEVIQGYLEALGSSRSELEKSFGSADRSSALHSIGDISETVERLRQDAADNHSAILNTSMEIKSNREHLPAAERFETINRLWVKYMDPMRDLIDVDKSMEALLDSLDRLLYSGTLQFGRHSELVREFIGCRARLLRMRRNIAADFHESLREIEPLYETLRVESELARGASVALRQIDREGVRSLDLDSMMALPSWRTEGLLSDVFLSGCLHDLSGYEPGEAPVVTGLEVESVRGFSDPEEVLSNLSLALPIDDLLVWLDLNCPGASLEDLLRLYGIVYCSPPGRVEFKSERREYMIREESVTSCPMAVLEAGVE